jgi:hypothetical protein
VRRRSSSTLLRARQAQPSQAERQTENHRHTRDQFHKAPFRTDSDHRVYYPRLAIAILTPIATSIPNQQARHIDVPAFPTPSPQQAKNRKNRASSGKGTL